MSVSATPNLGIGQTNVEQAPILNGDTFGFTNLEFQDAIEGEWFGYEASFSVRDGKPRNIPERYIPDEFRNWGVDVKGFDSLTSSVSSSDDTVLIKHTRALPSVGCEADAVIPEVSEQTWSNTKVDQVNGGFTDGSMSCGPALLTDELSQRWNACLVNATEEERVRVRVQFGPVDQPFGQVTAFIERWEGEFCSGEVLPGCGGKHSTFADDDVLDVGCLAGEWKTEGTVYNSTHEGWEKKTQNKSVVRTVADAECEVNVALPRGISLGMKKVDGGETHVIAGWMTSADKRVVMRRVYGTTGVLDSVSHEIETRVA